MTGQRGPFEVDQDRALDGMRVVWGDHYDLGFAEGAYRAARLNGTGDLLTCQTPDELYTALQTDWVSWRRP